MIWEHALSGWTVLASGQHCTASQGARTADVPTTMIRVGHAPYIAGLACVESRRLLKRSYTKLTVRHRRGYNLSGVYWVNMNRTVLCLDASAYPVELLRMFDEEALLDLQNVVFRWTVRYIGPVTRACQLLATLSPALRTIVIQIDKLRDAKERTHLDGSWFSQPMSVATADYYSTIPDREGPELAFDGLDCAYLRAHLLEHFIHTAPKVHVLPPISDLGPA